jgi:hypothetical protein
MHSLSRSLTLLALLYTCLASAQEGKQTYKVKQQSKPSLIMSVEHPTDSRGEAVYSDRGNDDGNVPAVEGQFVRPVPTDIPYPTFPKSMKRLFTSHKILVTGVIAANGDFIDPELSDSVKPDAKDAVIEAVSKYKFQPATLNGKAIALRAVIEFHFVLR